MQLPIKHTVRIVRIMAVIVSGSDPDSASCSSFRQLHPWGCRVHRHRRTINSIVTDNHQ